MDLVEEGHDGSLVDPKRDHSLSDRYFHRTLVVTLRWSCGGLRPQFEDDTVVLLSHLPNFTVKLFLYHLNLLRIRDFPCKTSSLQFLDFLRSLSCY